MSGSAWSAQDDEVGLAVSVGKAHASTDSLGNGSDTAEGSETSSTVPLRCRGSDVADLSEVPSSIFARTRVGPGTPTAAANPFGSDFADGCDVASAIRSRGAGTPTGSRVPLLPWAAVNPPPGCSIGSLETAASSTSRRTTTGSIPNHSWCDRTPPPSRAVSRRGTAPTPPAAGCVSPSQTPRCPAPALGLPRGDVTVCVRLRPGVQEDMCVFAAPDLPGSVRLRQPSTRSYENCETSYQYDVVFGVEATQEQVYEQAVAPICGAVIQGYNGAVIAYGQTGSGKTHTVVGNPRCKGMASRAVSAIFDALEKCPSYTVEVSVLEIYNERVRDLLAGGPGATHVEIHEVKSDGRGMSFQCPEATRRLAASPDDALLALADGMKRRETARTDMNHSSSRSHLIFSLTVAQRDQEIGATLRSRLHVVDLAGSERLKRSMASEQSPYPRSSLSSSGSRTPRDQRREAGEINKSLSQLALVIQRLTNANSSLHMIPYRDSMLTRLLAESFGGSSKTCLIITCSAQSVDREETRGSLEFGKRAKLVKNKAEINLEVACEPSPVVQAMVAREIEDLQQEKEEMVREKTRLLADLSLTRERLHRSEACTSEAVTDLMASQERHAADVRTLEEQKVAIQQRWVTAVREAASLQESSALELTKLQRDQQTLHQQLLAAASELAHAERERLKADSLHGEVAAEQRAALEVHRHCLEERACQVSELQGQLSEVSREEASALLEAREESAALRTKWQEDVLSLERGKLALAAELQEQEAALRSRWQEDVVRLEREKLSMSLEIQEQAAALRNQRQEAALRLETEKLAMQSHCDELRLSLEQRLRQATEASLASPVSDSERTGLADLEARAHAAEEERGCLAARFAEKGAALWGSVQLAISDSGQQDDARTLRLRALDVAASETRRKWSQFPGKRLMESSSSTSAPASTSTSSTSASTAASTSSRAPAPAPAPPAPAPTPASAEPADHAATPQVIDLHVAGVYKSCEAQALDGADLALAGAPAATLEAASAVRLVAPEGSLPSPPRSPPATRLGLSPPPSRAVGGCEHGAGSERINVW